jgi:uncharacterized heparinase superfamily protein
MGVTPVDQLATIAAYEGGRTQPMRRAPHSGYERLEAGRTVVIADVGPPPPIRQSGVAHAGCLSFELSSGSERIVVNCGAARGGAETMQRAARSTAAHSTAVVADVSSCRFLARQGWWGECLVAGWLLRRLDAVVLRGPEAISLERRDGSDGIDLSASHDGYQEPFGVTHRRRWRLSSAGDRLEVEDSFLRDSPQGEPMDVAIRFHLMPGIKASLIQDGQGVMLVLPNREVWRFEADVPVRLEDSVVFANPDGMRRTDQVVLAVTADETARWIFERLPKKARSAPDQSGGVQAELL